MKQEVPQSVIQTTASAHAKERDAAIDTATKMLRFTTHEPMTDGEVKAYMSGARDFWAFATYAILRDGNCRFEKE